MICQECGAEVEPAEYHPNAFCVLAQAGIDPKAMVAEAVGEMFTGEDTIAALLEYRTQQAASLMTENGKLRAEVERLRYANERTYCAYCGAEFRLDDSEIADAVDEHIRTCEAHPMRQSEAKVERLRAALQWVADHDQSARPNGGDPQWFAEQAPIRARKALGI